MPDEIAVWNSWIIRLAPAVGFEPTTKWLTATYSTAELCRSVFICSGAYFNMACNKNKHLFMFFRE